VGDPIGPIPTLCPLSLGSILLSKGTHNLYTGRQSLLITIDADMLMTEVVMRFWAGTPKLMYVLKMELAIVENPWIYLSPLMLTEYWGQKAYQRS
jgi:hypothetical protein